MSDVMSLSSQVGAQGSRAPSPVRMRPRSGSGAGAGSRRRSGSPSRAPRAPGSSGPGERGRSPVGRSVDAARSIENSLEYVRQGCLGSAAGESRMPMMRRHVFRLMDEGVVPVRGTRAVDQFDRPTLCSFVAAAPSVRVQPEVPRAPSYDALPGDLGESWTNDPVEMALFRDPWTAGTGHAVERSILATLARGESGAFVDPQTREPLVPEAMRPSWNLNGALSWWLNKRIGWKPEQLRAATMPEEDKEAVPGAEEPNESLTGYSGSKLWDKLEEQCQEQPYKSAAGMTAYLADILDDQPEACVYLSLVTRKVAHLPIYRVTRGPLDPDKQPYTEYLYVVRRIWPPTRQFAVLSRDTLLAAQFGRKRPRQKLYHLLCKYSPLREEKAPARIPYPGPHIALPDDQVVEAQYDRDPGILASRIELLGELEERHAMLELGLNLLHRELINADAVSNALFIARVAADGAGSLFRVATRYPRGNKMPDVDSNSSDARDFGTLEAAQAYLIGPEAYDMPDLFERVVWSRWQYLN